jgi:N-acyl homoserine lactone hydrolase
VSGTPERFESGSRFIFERRYVSAETQTPRIVTLDLGSVSPPKGHPDFGTPVVIQAFVIDTPRGAVLVDTGLGDAEATIDRMYQPRRWPLDVALSENGLIRERIAAIVVSHLHFDHVGALCDFPGIPIHVQREELEAARREPHYTILSRISGPALRFIHHDGDVQISEGIRLIATAGHTPGHQSVAVDTSDGLTILACQAAYVIEEWTNSSFEHPAGAASAWDRERYRKSLARLRAMSPVEVRLTHDCRIWRRQ